MKTLFQIICFIIFMAFIIINAWYDSTHDTLLFGNHFASLIGRYILGFLLIITSYKWKDVPFEWSTLGDFLIYGAAAWMIFDASFNFFRGIPLNYVGVTSWFDYFFHRFDPYAFTVQISVKGLILIAGIWLKIKY